MRLCSLVKCIIPQVIHSGSSILILLSDARQVVLEAPVEALNSLEMSLENDHGLAFLVVRIPLGVLLRQGNGRLHGVADLAPVPVHLQHLLRLEVLDGLVVDGDLARPVAVDLVEQGLPEHLAAGLVEGLEVDDGVDSRHECLVNVADAVCGEEEQAREILDVAEKSCVAECQHNASHVLGRSRLTCNNAIACYVKCFTTFQEDITLVNQKNCLPPFSQSKPLAQLCLDLVLFDADFGDG